VNEPERIESVIVRVDGSRDIGHGHIFRTLVLADALAAGGARVTFLCSDLPGAPLERVRERGHALVVIPEKMSDSEEINSIRKVGSEQGKQWLVVDRYASTPDFYRAARADRFRVLAIDDIAEHPYPVDILMNQNIDAGALTYAVDPETRCLLGPEFSLIAPAYREARPAEPPTLERAQRVLLFMGGGDSVNATGTVLAAIDAIEPSADSPLDIQVVVGGGSQFAGRVREQAARHRHNVRVGQNLSDLVGVMHAADVCICAGGSTVWELCCLGLPMAWLTIAENQRGIAAGLARAGCGIALGDFSDATPAGLSRSLADWFQGDAGSLRDQAAAAWNIVDGHGVERVIASMQQTLRYAVQP